TPEVCAGGDSHAPAAGVSAGDRRGARRRRCGAAFSGSAEPRLTLFFLFLFLLLRGGKSDPRAHDRADHGPEPRHDGPSRAANERARNRAVLIGPSFGPVPHPDRFFVAHVAHVAHGASSVKRQLRCYPIRRVGATSLLPGGGVPNLFRLPAQRGAKSRYPSATAIPHYGKAVARIAGRSDMRRIQAVRRGRPVVRSPGPLFRAMSRDTATVRCAMPGSACISGSAARVSKKSAMRWLRATS